MKDAEFGNRLRLIRTQFYSSKSQKEAALEMGIGSTTYQKAEAGQVPSGDTLIKIAKHFKINLHWLLTGEGTENPPPTPHSDLYAVEIGERLRQTRRPGLAKDIYAKILGISFVTYDAMTDGRVPIDASVIYKLFDKFKINPTWLVTGEGEKFTDEIVREPYFEQSISCNTLELDSNVEESINRGPLKTLPQDRFWKNLSEYLSEISSDPVFKGWFQVEFINRFQEFSHWMATRLSKQKPDSDIDND